MAFFGKNKTAEGKASKAAEITADVVSSIETRPGQRWFAAPVIFHPRVTEKAHSLSETSNVYIFNVKQGATKGMVQEAIKSLYKVSPVQVAIVPIPKKKRFSRGKVGVSGGGRKAYVYLKEGDKLEIA